MSEKIIISLSVITILLTNITMCFASSELKRVEKQITVDYNMSDERYSNIDKTLVEDKVYYELENVDRKDNLKTLTMEHELVDEKVITTNKLESVIEMFNTTKDIEVDGYTGTIRKDNSSLKIDIKDSYQEEYKVYLQKSYDNVPSNELNDIPKEIKANGTTYYLVNPVWNIVETEIVSNNEVPAKYSGTMYYEGVKTRTIVTTYLATIKYIGTLSKQVPETTTFTVKYREVKEYDYIVSAIVGTTGIIFISGITLFKLKNVKIYNLQDGEYKLTKRIHLNKDKLLIDLTPINLQTRAYKIVFSKSLYRVIKGKNIKFKYFDKVQNYTIVNKEFEIIV
ncbi:MAG: hypothetical protein Q4G09_03525 [Clostridia bacterium]|nr:hypothetical protein [Clostridia bacterium]